MYFVFDDKGELWANRIRYFLEHRPAGENTYAELWQKYREQELKKKK